VVLQLSNISRYSEQQWDAWNALTSFDSLSPTAAIEAHPSSYDFISQKLKNMKKRRPVTPLE
jgi:hypothetical protein